MIPTFTVDHCILFSADGVQPILMLRGWYVAFDKQSLATIEVIVSSGQVDAMFSTGPQACCEQRADVAQVIPGAEKDTGFDLVIPLPFESVEEVRCLFRVGSDLLADHKTPVNAGGDTQGFCSKLGIDFRLSRKVHNLLLSEAESASGVAVRQSTPIALSIDTAFSCNLECPHCTSHFLSVRPGTL